MYQAKDLLNSSIKKLNVKLSKSTAKHFNETKSEKIIQLYLDPNSEEEIAKILYFEGKDQNFRKLKSRMIEKSADAILAQVGNVKFRNNYDKSVFMVQKLLFVSNLLIMKDNRNFAQSLLRKALRISLSIHYTPYIILIARQLSYSYAYKGDVKSVKNFSKIANDNYNLYKDELEMEAVYNYLLTRITVSAEYSKETKNEIKSAFVRVTNILKENKSHSLQLLYFRIGIMYFHSLHNFTKLIELTKSAIKYITSSSVFNQNSKIGEFSLYEMDSCLRLKSYTLGDECAARCLKYFVPYTSPWSVFNEYYFLLSMRTLNFKKASEIYDLINGSRYKLGGMLARQKDKWKIYEAFLHFATDDFSSSKQFNLYKYLNEIDLLDRDKRGFNFLVIISKFLLLLNIQNHNGLIQMEDSFRSYFRRYIDSTEFPRHFIFGKFILFLFKQNFAILDSDTSFYIEKLETFTVLEETEVIPYEKLIGMLTVKCNQFSKTIN